MSLTTRIDRRTLPQKPFVVRNGDAQICFAVICNRDTSRIDWMTWDQRNCTRCVRRVIAMSQMIFDGTRIKFSASIENTFPGFSTEINPVGCKPTGIRILRAQIPNNDHVVGGYTHYTLTLEQVSNISDDRATEIEHAFHLYFQILQKDIIEIVRSGIASIEIIERSVRNIGADHIYGDSLTLMRNIAETCHAKMSDLEMIYAVVRILSGITLVREMNGRIVSRLIQQMHQNTIELLELAQNDIELEKMIKFRMDPQTYPKPTRLVQAQKLKTIKRIVRKALGGHDPMNRLVSRDILASSAFYKAPSDFEARLARQHLTISFDRCQHLSLRGILADHTNTIHVYGLQEATLVISNAANILQPVTVYGGKNLPYGQCYQMASRVKADNTPIWITGIQKVIFAVILITNGKRIVYFQTNASPPKTCTNFFIKENLLPSYNSVDVYQALNVNPLPITTPDFVSHGCAITIHDTIDITLDVNGERVHVTKF